MIYKIICGITVFMCLNGCADSVSDQSRTFNQYIYTCAGGTNYVTNTSDLTKSGDETSTPESDAQADISVPVSVTP